MSKEIRRVAVLDDSPADLEMTVFAVEDAGYEAIVVEAPSSIDDALRRVRESDVDGVVTDHELSWGTHAAFNGAEFAVRCYAEQIPAVLVTGWLADVSTTIRTHRREVPSLVLRNDLDGAGLRRAFEVVQHELEDRPDPARQPHSALIRVLRVNEPSQQVDVVVAQWNPRLKVSLPATLFTRDLSDLSSLPLRILRGQVNTGAENADDLYFSDMEDAGPVRADDEFLK
jgi:CheY-like chemotaxis protein